MSRFLLPLESTFNINGLPQDGAKLEFFEVGTTTLKDTYSDEALSIPNANPVIASGTGRFGSIWLNGDYDVTLKSKDDVLVWGAETIRSLQSSIALNTTKNYETMPALVAKITSDNIKIDDLIYLEERSTGNGGGGWWKAIDATTSPGNAQNGYNIVSGNSSITFKLIHDGSITPEQWGISDSTTIEVDDSVGIQLIFDNASIHRVIGDPSKTYFFKLIETNRTKLTWTGGNFKFKRTLTLINTYNWNQPFGGAAESTGNEWMIKITKPTLSRGNGIVFKNVTIDGNALIYNSSAGHPNLFIQLFHIKETADVMFENCDIAEINGNAILAERSERIHISGGSVLRSAAIQSSIYSNEQVAFIGSARCTINNVDMGEVGADSSIATVGGLTEAVDGTEIGGFVPFNSPDGTYSGYTWFGIACGASDSFHVITNNVVRSDTLDASSIYTNFAGGLPGRIVTINSGHCIVKDNLIYDTLDISQAGIGLGHERVTQGGGLPVYGISAARAEVSGNIIFGFKKSGQGYGINNDGSEDVNVRDNEIYNCNNAVNHSRYATTSRYNNNWMFYNDVSFNIADPSGSSNSHGIVDLIQISNNECWNNLQDVVVSNASTYASLEIKQNSFKQVRSNALEQFSIYHGGLDWKSNEVINNSTVKVGTIYARAVGRHVNFSDTTIECLVDSSQDLLIFDGASSDTVGRGSLVINDLTVDCPSGSLNRRLNIRRDSTKGVSMSNPHMTNCKIVFQSIAGEISIDGGQMSTQGATDEALSINLNNVAIPRLAQVNNVMFPKVGNANPILLNITAGAGYAVVNSCTTKENKEVTNKANGNTMRNNNCWKVTAGVLTASRP